MSSTTSKNADVYFKVSRREGSPCVYVWIVTLKARFKQQSFRNYPMMYADNGKTYFTMKDWLKAKVLFEKSGLIVSNDRPSWMN
jgi:hypothetical protein